MNSENAEATDAASCDQEFSLAKSAAMDNATVTSNEYCSNGLDIAGLDDCSQEYDIAQTETDTETDNGDKPTESAGESVENDTVNTKGGASGVESGAETTDGVEKDSETVLQSGTSSILLGR